MVPSVHLGCYTRLFTRNQKCFSHRSGSCEVQDYGTDRFNIWQSLFQGQQSSCNFMGGKGQGSSLQSFLIRTLIIFIRIPSSLLYQIKSHLQIPHLFIRFQCIYFERAQTFSLNGINKNELRF